LSQLQAAEAQSQLTPQWQVGPQVQMFSLGGQAQVWLQVQASVWLLSVI
jgi:hypothetical protein